MSYLQDNSSLRILNLSWNGFYLEGCRALVRTLQFNSTLEVLDLSNNRINRECLGHLVKGLAKNTTLHTLIVSHISHFSRTSDRDFCCFSLCEITHTVPACGKDKLEDLKVLRRSPDLLNNCKTGQGQLQLIMKHILFYHIWGLQLFWFSNLNNLTAQ